jgi:hypothetical protein
MFTNVSLLKRHGDFKDFTKFHKTEAFKNGVGA